ncbi:MAG: 50S ribosomal protein L9 [Atopobiaceae bacterium]|nr:50S ribosomal protein L9 [Atopobiaceae bacterium]
MKVILLGELRGKGGEGDVVDVAQGYAENYLFPNRMAIAATPGNIKQLEERRHNIAKREERRIADAEATKAALDGKRVLINVKVGEEGQLYGSVTTAMIAEAVEAQLGVIIDRKRIERTAAIKTAGEHEVTVNLYREINAQLGLLVGDGTQAPAEEAPEAEPEPEVVEAEAEVEAEEAPAEDAE